MKLVGSAKLQLDRRASSRVICANWLPIVSSKEMPKCVLLKREDRRR